jgi:hypothetical protein
LSVHMAYVRAFMFPRQRQTDANSGLRVSLTITKQASSCLNSSEAESKLL